MKKMLLFLFLMFFHISIFAEPIRDVVFFGDSLSDDGNLIQYLKILPTSPPYYEGRFSNGRTWAEYVGDYFYRTQYASYSNYAYGGATAILHHLRSDSFVAPMLLGVEIDSYLIHTALKDRNDTLFTFWIGANDYLYERMPDINKLTDDVVSKILESISKVIMNGGKHFLILNLPDMSKSPYAYNHDMIDRLKKLTDMNNEKLKDAVTQLKNAYPNLDIHFIDVNAILTDVFNDPDKYNQKYGTHVTDFTNSCWLGGMVDRSSDLQPCANPDNYFFWDEMHPTAVIHKILGEIIVEQLMTGH